MTETEVRRLFVCVDPSAEAVTDLGTVVDDLEVARANQPGRSTRIAARDRWHITLAFLGDVRVDRIDRCRQALDTAGAGRAGRPIAIRFAGGGTFGRGRLTILWTGLGGDVDGLRDLAATVRAELRRQRVAFDTKPFRPHVTIARPGGRVESDLLARDVATLDAYVGPEWTVPNMHLVASDLGPSPVYTTLHTVAL